jgi:hypothetical protein
VGRLKQGGVDFALSRCMDLAFLLSGVAFLFIFIFSLLATVSLGGDATAIGGLSLSGDGEARISGVKSGHRSKQFLVEDVQAETRTQQV